MARSVGGFLSRDVSDRVIKGVMLFIFLLFHLLFLFCNYSVTYFGWDGGIVREVKIGHYGHVALILTRKMLTTNKL